MKYILVFLLFSFEVLAQKPTLKIAKLKYGGGGDWYANKTSLTNLIRFANTNLRLNLETEEDIVEPSSADIFSYPFIHMTGHGNVNFTDTDALNLRKYLVSGGFLHIDDNYGMDKYIRKEMKKVFPDLEFIELPFDHPIYHQKFNFAKGLPKVHEHDGSPPQGYGLILQGKLVCFYSYECDLGNGWEDKAVYNDPEEVRQQALKMGANILQFCFTNY